MADLRSNMPCRNERCPICRTELLVGLVDGVRTAVDACPITKRAETLYRLAGVMVYQLAHGGLQWQPAFELERPCFPAHRCGKSPPRHMRATLPPPPTRSPQYEGEFPF